MALHHDPLWPRAGAWNSDAPRVDFGIIGVPTFSTSITPGSTNLTPDAVRAVIPRYSEMTFGPNGARNADSLERADFGDVVDPDGDEPGAIDAIRRAASRAKLLVAIGGDNALTVPVAVGAWGEESATAGLITVDAHLDVRHGRSNGSPVRRLVDEFGLDPTRIVQIGIAEFANSVDYIEQVQSWGVTVITRDDVERRGVDAVVVEALRIAGGAGGPIHVDLDIDACDRSVAPACPASIPGGFTAYEMRQFARQFARSESVRSIDLAEVDAAEDAPDGRTVRLTALCVLEALAGVLER
jgi:arginase family enzyme